MTLHAPGLSGLKADKVVLFLCLPIAIVLFTEGFFVPPMGQLDGSVL